jgi:hypothetical protein
VSLILVKTGRGGKSRTPCIREGEGRCRNCGSSILWVLTPRGRKMPIDPPAAGTDETESHFATCAARRKRKTA